MWEPVAASSQVFRVASCSNNVQLWDAFNGGNARTYQTAHGQVFSLSWCHSTFKIVSGNADGTADIWIASQTQFVNRLSGHNAAIRGVSWAKNGIHVATASDDTRVGLWPLDTQHNDRATPIFLQGHRKSVYTVSFSEDASPYLVSGSADGTAILWQVKQTTPLATYAGHQGDVRTVVFAPGSSQSSGLRIASGGADQTAQVWTWDPAGKTLPQIARYTGHHATINSLAWSPDGQRIASGDSSGQVHIWHSQTGVQLLTFQAHQAGVSSLGWAPNGQHLASAGLDGVAHIVQIS